MHSLYLFNLIISVLIIVDSASSSVCNCTNQTLCNVIPAPDKVVLGFTRGFDNYKLYDWSRINTVVPFVPRKEMQIEFICYAHSYGVSVLIPPAITIDIVLNVSRHSAAIADILKDVQSLVVDGVNFDFEGPLTSDESKLYTMLVSKTRAALLSINKLYQVSVDVAWSANCIDGRCYDSLGLSQVTDYLVIMAYDEQSQMAGPPCYANANSPFNQTADGIQSYFKSGIKEFSLVLGLPWYGYNYTCLSVNRHNDRCQIQAKSYRNSQCSDAVGHQLSYSYFMNLLQNGARKEWNSDALTPYFMLHSQNTYQLWYDDPVSLGFKYNMAGTLNLRGIGFWDLDQMDYSDTPQNVIMRKEMWETIDVFWDHDQDN